MSTYPNQIFIRSGNSYTALDTNLYIGWNSPDASVKTVTIPISIGSLTTIVVQDVFGNAATYQITIVPVSGYIIGSNLIQSNNGSITLLDTTQGWSVVSAPSSSGSSTSPGGSDTDVQYNSSGSFAGDSGFTYDGAGHVSATSFNGFLTTSDISQWTNDSGYITSAGAPLQSVSNSDGTLTISPTTGNVVASLNLANANLWGVNQSSPAWVTAGGTSSEIVKGDGSLDSTVYLTSATAVTSFNGGTTGLLPSGATVGAVTLSGTLVVANGGTGSTSFTANSIPFSNGSILTQDNANFAWTDSTQILTIGKGIAFNANASNITTGANASGAGFAFSLTGSSSTGNGSFAGGALTFVAGAGASNSSAVSFQSAGTGGGMSFTGGVGGNYTGTGTLGQAAGFGGSITMTGGTGGSNARTNGITGSGGNVSFTGGNGLATTVVTQGGGGGGAVAFLGGAGANAATGGLGGNASLGSGNGGNATVTNASLANTGGVGGSVSFQSGVGGNASGSSVSNTAGAGGDLTLSAGHAGTATGTGAAGARGGNFTFQGGAATASTGISAAGGNLYFIGGASGPSGGQTGYVILNGNGTTTRGGTIIGANTAPGSQLQVNPISASVIGTIIQGASSQSADLTQWQNSSAVVLAKVTSTGEIVTAASTTTSSGFNLPSGTLPTSPVDGNLVNDGTHLQYTSGSTVYQIDRQAIAGSFSATGATTTTFTVTIGTTQANNSYKVNVTPTDTLAAAPLYVNNKTTTTFDVVYLIGLTGFVAFDWSLFP